MTEPSSSTPSDLPPSDPEKLRRLPWARTLVVGLSLLLVALLAYGVLAKSPDTSIDDGLTSGKPKAAPGFDLRVLARGSLGPLERRLAPPLANGRVDLEELRGNPVVVNFWASWCAPCREEAPRLQRAWRRARPAGVIFVGLNIQDVTPDARAFLREFSTSYLNVRDGGGSVGRDWGLTGIPETFFVDGKGRVVAHVIGAISDDQLRTGVDSAIAGRPQAARSGGARQPAR